MTFSNKTTLSNAKMFKVHVFILLYYNNNITSTIGKGRFTFKKKNMLIKCFS